MAEEKQDSKTTQTDQKSTSIFPAAVARVLDAYTVVINRGSQHGLRNGQRFLVYALSEDEIVDPTTNDSLGYLEIIRGTGVVKHIQNTMATIESDEKVPGEKRVIRRKPRRSYFELNREPDEEVIEPGNRTVPFDGAEIGDKARPI
jgi:hypothetical protein